MYTLPKEDLEHVWNTVSDCLFKMQNARLFITGGTGFFGHWLLESILFANQNFNSNISAVILTRDPQAFLTKSPHFKKTSCFEFLQGDVCHFDFPKGEFSYVIHAATEASAALNQNHPLKMFDTIMLGTRRVLEFSVKANVKDFLFISSGAIYGKQPHDITHIPESYISNHNPLNLSSAYGIGKLSAEHLCLLFHKAFQLPVKIARCFAFVGPYLPLNTHFAIGNFIAQTIQKESITIAGDGSPFRSYLYMADLTAWLLKILCDGKIGEAYNVGSEHAINIKNLAHIIAQEAHPTLPVNIAKIYDATTYPEHYVPDVCKAKNELNLSQTIALSDAIRRTIKWNQSYAKII